MFGLDFRSFIRYAYIKLLPHPRTNNNHLLLSQRKHLFIHISTNSCLKLRRSSSFSIAMNSKFHKILKTV